MERLAAGDPVAVGQYRLVGSLGEGGMGRVWLGVAPDGRLAAVKLVHPHLARDPGFRSRFRREVEVSRAVSGAYTAAVLDADTDAAAPWLASVYVPGLSLRQAVDLAGPLPVHTLRVLTAGLASALADIHRAGLIHRDLKPSNVLLAEDGPRVIDFGIARAIEGNHELTSTGSIIGSPGFMSPEQALGAGLTPASDVFSLGAMLVMAAVGHGPFAGNSTPQILYNVVHATPRLDGVPMPLRALLGACLDKTPSRRPEPRQILDAVAGASTALGWLPPPVAMAADQHRAQARALVTGTPAPKKRMRATRWVLAALLTVLVVAGGVFTAIQLGSPGELPAASYDRMPGWCRNFTPDALRTVSVAHPYPEATGEHGSTVSCEWIGEPNVNHFYVSRSAVDDAPGEFERRASNEGFYQASGSTVGTGCRWKHSGRAGELTVELLAHDAHALVNIKFASDRLDMGNEADIEKARQLLLPLANTALTSGS
ncbi:serine/threonine-protein kinase [Amycolatopsis sp. EV170708-02-1]|uniref:serine/threonine-protein kinase n=1 Tax=Amycolatopsis sp. EV170708-02-1 TaxID=2919322 RepID=UPI0028F3E8B5|nr:serine/threonine-protein kinase [Amycolatopsis sp. EV170708-02-1]